MNPTLIATFAGLITALCWGTSDWLSAKSTKQHSVLEINFTVQSISLVWMAILFLVSGVHIGNGEELFRIGLGNILVMMGYLIFVEALSTGAVGIIVPLGNIYPLVTIILSAIFLSMHFMALQLLAMLGIVLGAAVLAYEKNTQKIPFKQLHRETVLALAAAAVWGIGFFVIDPVVTQVSWQTISILGEVFSFSFALLLIVAIRRKQAPAAIQQSLRAKLPLVVGTLGITGAVAIYVGSTRAGSVVIPTVMSAGGPLVASVWGAFVDKEKIGTLKRLGAVIVVGGIILLNVA